MYCELAYYMQTRLVHSKVLKFVIKLCMYIVCDRTKWFMLATMYDVVMYIKRSNIYQLCDNLKKIIARPPINTQPSPVFLRFQIEIGKIT